jgi:sialidase-1
LQHGSVLLSVLSDKDSNGQVHAAESLYKVGWSGDASALRAAFSDCSEMRLRLMAAAALAKHCEHSVRKDAFSFLRENLRSESDPAIFRLSAWVLGRIGESGDRDLIRSRLDDAQTDTLVFAFLEHALAALGDPRGRQALLRNFESKDPVIRTYAAIFAGESGMMEASPNLIRQLDDKNLDARIRAAHALLLLFGQDL